MGFLKSIVRHSPKSLSGGLRYVSRKASRSLNKFSHKTGRVIDKAFGFSKVGKLTERAITRLQTSLARSSMRAASRASGTNNATTLQYASPGRLQVGSTNYEYRRLKDLM